ncbi:enoyl-CoA hydratase/carnithine racemase [Halogeometricum borinquense DSM 11551]|uniref:Enoyl-CoA hydratase/carnithine racemase n=2 Tax=Halogeometricum borinquense TaxID=60847 RepID=E4NVR7_HALBP|nr:enoyl-CoA hydratase/carnithine racemase [Halogeometricum borinquense DSM 11551]ELY31808.1 enoyl-CoA hydratase/carnithine racemase [Halogeometricum borinquense DSM 11551]RYJ08413.1 enoyl-CoA hydratase [Halogeometricum borinquense]
MQFTRNALLVSYSTRSEINDGEISYRIPRKSSRLLRELTNQFVTGTRRLATTTSELWRPFEQTADK